MGVRGLTTEGVVEYHEVIDGLKDRKFLVEYNIKNNNTKCGCKLFERCSFVCRHIIWVWNRRKVVEDYGEADIKKMEMSKVWSEIYATVGVLDNTGTFKQMKQLEKMLKQFRENITGPVASKTKNKEIEDLLGITTSNEIDIRPPRKAKNKGSGKRLMTSKEKSIRKQQKRKRRCSNCKKWVNHNSRTCNLPFVDRPPSDDDEEESETEEEDSSDA
ncbi:uncharacterized protein LOC141632741 [Silene latifolia]|uniref:uncharacterized protein LOC141632741 n=1 Tax=Silene latifolia TaxID=37657 RepID=UPI003D772123